MGPRQWVLNYFLSLPTEKAVGDQYEKLALDLHIATNRSSAQLYQALLDWTELERCATVLKLPFYQVYSRVALATIYWDYSTISTEVDETLDIAAKTFGEAYDLAIKHEIFIAVVGCTIGKACCCRQMQKYQEALDIIERCKRDVMMSFKDVFDIQKLQVRIIDQMNEPVTLHQFLCEN